MPKRKLDENNGLIGELNILSISEPKTPLTPSTIISDTVPPLAPKKQRLEAGQERNFIVLPSVRRLFFPPAESDATSKKTVLQR